MAPRGRQKKVGLRRIDAALDALCALGFSKDVVNKTINELLKAYGGDTGWVFIEEASYKLVIDTILDQQEEHDQKATTPENDKDDVTAQAVQSDPTREANLFSEQRRERNFVDAGVQAEPEKMRPPCYGWISEDEEEEEENIGNVTPVLQRDAFQKNVSCKRSRKRKSMWDIMHPTFPYMSDALYPTLRPPCYGWISEDEEEEENIGNATPMLQRDAFQKSVSCKHSGKRKSVWDITHPT